MHWDSAVPGIVLDAGHTQWSAEQVTWQGKIPKGIFDKKSTLLLYAVWYHFCTNQAKQS